MPEQTRYMYYLSIMYTYCTFPRYKSEKYLVNNFYKIYLIHIENLKLISAIGLRYYNIYCSSKIHYCYLKN